MEKLIIGGIYRHFKGNYYLVEAIVKNADNAEEMVLYRTLYADGSLWVRPLQEFLSDVDTLKYPNVTQKRRFEYVKVERE